MSPIRNKTFMISTVALLALAGCKTAPQTRPEPDEPSAEDAEQVQLMEMAAGSAGSHPCTDASWHWSSTSPKVNRLHVFCGEIGSNKSPKGFHSIVHQKASSVVTGVGKKKNNHNGIYDADVSFAAPATPSTKMSTFFPDTCSEDQITESILYAANNQTGPHSAWGVLGPSAPKTGGHQYCLDSKGKPFTIRMGLTRSDVNTAFPN